MQKFIFLIASIIAICFNSLDVYKLYGGQSTTFISDNFASTIITPDGFTFAIWSVIFLMFLVVGILNIKNPLLISKKALLYFLGSCTSISLWIVFFQLQIPYVPTFLLLLILLFNLLVSFELPTKIKHFYLIYTSWTLIASVISVTVLFQYDFKIDNFLGLPNQITALIILGIGVVLLTFLSFKFNSVTPVIVGVWAYFGISRASELTEYLLNIKLGSIIYALILLVMALVVVYKNKNLRFGSNKKR